MIEKSFYNELYNFNFKIYIGTLNELNEERKILNEPPINPVGAFTSYYNERRGDFYFVENEIDFGIISHEAFHCVQYIYETIGQKISTSSDEPAAYLLQWITNRIYLCIPKELKKQMLY